MEDPETPHVEIVDDDRLEVREAISDRLGKLWWAFLLRGVLAAALGIAALFWPTGSIALLLQLVGILLILDGGLTLFGFGRRGPAGGLGIGAIVIGLVLLIWPEGTARFAFFLLGAFAVATGLGSLSTWRRMPEWDPERGTARNAGLVALLVGLILIFWPGSGLVALSWAIAFVALAAAAVMFWLAARFRTANQTLKPRVINPR
ncbi:DUF308 domain-containing protein [Roseibacterium sp. SDUM158016]|uniref:HdeD family acid-resistance protein n=1 Tax=Roseicyclus sediminis TaxID=2980997 RepID=UPI0021D089DE|nr:DUF308 domain-containing protein [Roseibacterium sp. SDUM158016]MCU4654813.1 DUF308 domain-containing protein [Roseibacterium sp. SDUM158016]